MLSAQTVTSDAIIADVTQFLGDDEFRLRSKGWYQEKIKRILEKLSTQYFIFTTWNDGLFSDSSTPLAIPVPDDFINPQKIYIYNDKCCSPGADLRIVHFKVNFVTTPGGKAYSADKHDDQPYDPYYNPYVTGGRTFDHTNLYYANMEGGYLMFSRNCAEFAKYRIIYNTFGGALDEIPTVPREYRQVVTDMMNRDCSMLLMRHDIKLFSTMSAIATQALMNQQDGSWWAFIRNAVAMSEWMRNDMDERNNNAKWYK